jgi:phosphoglucomutase
MTVDHDGKIRMDCSSQYAMAGLVHIKDHFTMAWANDADADRHFIVTRFSGLMNPNHFLAVAIRYLLDHRADWPMTSVVGKTVVSNGIIDRVVHQHGHGRSLKSPSALNDLCPASSMEPVASEAKKAPAQVFYGATVLPGLPTRMAWLFSQQKSRRLRGRIPLNICARFAWSLTALITHELIRRSRQSRSSGCKRSMLNAIRASELAGERIISKLTSAPGNGAPLSGVKVETASGWFAVRPSGTEHIYKIYAESFKDQRHLGAIVDQARQLVDDALRPQ